MIRLDTDKENEVRTRIEEGMNGTMIKEKYPVILNIIEHSYPIKQTEISFHMMVIAAEVHWPEKMLTFEQTYVWILKWNIASMCVRHTHILDENLPKYPTCDMYCIFADKALVQYSQTTAGQNIYRDLTHSLVKSPVFSSGLWEIKILCLMFSSIK